MKARFVGTVSVLATGVLVLALAWNAAAAASPPGGGEEMMPPPGEGGEMMPPPGEGGEMMPPPPGPGGRWRKGKGFGKDLEKLDLTAEQKAKIKAQRKEQKEVMDLIRGALKAKHEELRAEIDKEKSDPAKIEKLTAELKKLEGQRVDREIKGILQMKEVLTPEQFKKLGALRDEHRKDMEGKRGRGRGHGPRRGRGGDDDEAECRAKAEPAPEAAPAPEAKAE